ncbi:baculoviral IAP repeat-containing protein 3-like [Planococcus citri]|uniref:baculoviral IAP repeat-containing protein 3-like n=1 Tax=Planococcus citri TaxID=170843 RepID=UPI0031FA1FCD
MNRAALPQRPLRGRGCIRETKWRTRRFQGIGGLLRSIHDLNENVYDADDDLLEVRRKLQKSRGKLGDILDKIDRLKEDLVVRKDALQKNTQELRAAIDDLNLPNSLYNLNEEENNVLKMDLWMSEEDIVEARNHIHDAEDDLNFEVIHELMNKKTADGTESEIIESGVRNFDSITLPNVISNGLIPNNGIVKMNRSKCCVCLKAKLDCVLYKCGHVCTCYTCTELILADRENRKCPVCRSPIKDVIKTYFVC